MTTKNRYHLLNSILKTYCLKFGTYLFYNFILLFSKAKSPIGKERKYWVIAQYNIVLEFPLLVFIVIVLVIFLPIVENNQNKITKE